MHPNYGYYPPPKGISALGLVSIIMGSIALLLSWIPVVSWLALVLALLALFCGVVGLFLSASDRVGGGVPLAGTLLSAVAVAIALICSLLWI